MINKRDMVALKRSPEATKHKVLLLSFEGRTEVKKSMSGGQFMNYTCFILL